MARNTAATGLIDAVAAAATTAMTIHARDHARTARSTSASPRANGARPTITLTSTTAANTWLAADVVADGSRSTVTHVKQYVATIAPTATTANGPIHAMRAGANKL